MKIELNDFYKCPNCGFIAFGRYFKSEENVTSLHCGKCVTSFIIDELVKLEYVLICSLCGWLIGIDEHSECEHSNSRYTLHNGSGNPISE